MGEFIEHLNITVHPVTEQKYLGRATGRQRLWITTWRRRKTPIPFGKYKCKHLKGGAYLG
jgi:hypothetical protein